MKEREKGNQRKSHVKPALCEGNLLHDDIFCNGINHVTCVCACLFYMFLCVLCVLCCAVSGE